MRERAEPATEVLLALAGLFGRRGLSWYLSDARAIALWGRPATGTEVDVTVALGALAPADLVRDLATAGFTLRLGSAFAEFVERHRLVPVVHEASGIPVDIVLAGSSLEEIFLERAVPVLVAGRPIPVISPEDLVVTKVLAGRPKDLEEIRGILATQGGKLDRERVRETLSALEQALGQRDLLPRFEAELAPAR